jgi:hypothetical protein
MANTLKFGNGQWATKVGSTLAYNDENGNFKPLPFDFTRSTSATRVNKDGLIKVVTNNKPRIDFLNDSNGALLLEPERTNLITYSELFSTWTSVNSAIASDTTDVISLDGTLNAQLLVSGGTGSVQGIYKNISFLNTTTYTMSVFAKKKEISFIQLQGGGAGWAGNTFANFDLQNGVVGSIGSGAISHSIENYGNGWYRCSFTATKTASGGNLSVDLINSATDGRDVVYNGNIGDGVYLFASQAEQGSYATSYIPTQGAIATRVGEVCTGAGNDQVINSTEGVLYAEISAFDNISRISLSDGSSSNRVSFRIDASSIDFQYRTGGSYSYRVDVNIDTSNTNKIAMSFNNGVFVGYLNGVAIGSPISGASLGQGVLDRLNFNDGDSSDSFNGNVKDVRIYNTALTDQELINLTTI